MEYWNHTTEVLGALAGLLYVYLEIRQRRWMWIVGGLSALVYIFVFFDAGLYAAMAFQLYYIAASIYGWKKWGRGSSAAEDVHSTVRMSLKTAFVSMALIAAATFLFWILLRRIDSDPMPFADGFIVALSMVATYWVGNKYIEHWYLWFIANSLSIYMYMSQELYPTMILYIVFLIASVIGYIRWRKFRRILI